MVNAFKESIGLYTVVVGYPSCKKSAIIKLFNESIKEMQKFLEIKESSFIKDNSKYKHY